MKQMLARIPVVSLFFAGSASALEMRAVRIDAIASEPD
jgi:hypothetical protein